jgi:hypothetical protein
MCKSDAEFAGELAGRLGLPDSAPPHYSDDSRDAWHVGWNSVRDAVYRSLTMDSIWRNLQQRINNEVGPRMVQREATQ